MFKNVDYPNLKEGESYRLPVSFWPFDGLSVKVYRDGTRWVAKSESLPSMSFILTPEDMLCPCKLDWVDE